MPKNLVKSGDAYVCADCYKQSHAPAAKPAAKPAQSERVSRSREPMDPAQKKKLVMAVVIFALVGMVYTGYFLGWF
jgi:uncharacterized ion transporter superfamily protein YfcC